jgi:hypothetical protein
MPQSGELYEWVGTRDNSRSVTPAESNGGDSTDTGTEFASTSHDSTSHDVITSRYLYGTLEEAINESKYHQRHYDSVRRKYVVNRVEITRETPSELDHKRDLAQIESLLKIYILHDITHAVKSLLARSCEGCICNDVAYRKHICRCSPKDIVDRFYDEAWAILSHRQIIDGFIDDVKRGEGQDMFPHVSELTFYRYLPGTDYRRRFMNRDFHAEVKIMVETHLRLLAIPTAPPCAFPGQPATSRQRNRKRVRPTRNQTPANSPPRTVSPPHTYTLPASV